MAYGLSNGHVTFEDT